MIAIDTNLLLRYFIKDDIQQSNLVDQLTLQRNLMILIHPISSNKNFYT